jgi:uncharacterized membrane protein YfcA
MITPIFLYLMIGILAGLMSGMFGIGGGSVRIPLLYVAGLPLLSVFGINLFVIPISSLVGALSHWKNICWKFVPYILIGASCGSILGALLAGLLHDLTLAILFLIVSLITILGIYFDRISPKVAQKINPKAGHFIGGTLFINLIIGMRGGSGGSLFPSFFRMMKMNIHEAIATSLFSTIFSAAAAIVIYWYRGNIILLPALVVILGSIIGARLGSIISLKTKPHWLEIGLSVFVIILALITVFKSIHHG